MILKKLLVALSLLTSTTVLAGTIDSAALSGTANQFVEVTFQEPLAVKHALNIAAAKFTAGKMSDETVLATGEVNVTAGTLKAGQSLAAAPKHVPANAQSGPKWTTGQAIDTSVLSNTFNFTMTAGEPTENISVKDAGGKKWLVEQNDTLHYRIILSRDAVIKPGKYTISIDAAVYSE
ncbi:hypothetical protein BTJ39_14295 [Izhakiella australiensis]|uniref:Saf-pilin pilus formation protein domain-containing protein n=1 Tax=Izhakiella australiensis TaxID=1926881 RepID=A0A1S8YK31_9GAMM|nr:hypothetical protein [Izhakiella australiensis]OON39444.1 hypothetical protein BTJ39_14295 [Izhakiella australiensis]